jgi:hypothetical protein
MVEARPSNTATKDECHLLAIAPELRNSIYEYTLIAPEPLNTVKRISRFSSEKGAMIRGSEFRQEPALLWTCKQIRAEALPIFYGANTFHDSAQDIGGFWFLRHLTAEKRAVLRALRVSYRFDRFDRAWTNIPKEQTSLKALLKWDPFKCLSLLAHANPARLGQGLYGRDEAPAVERRPEHTRLTLEVNGAPLKKGVLLAPIKAPFADAHGVKVTKYIWTKDPVKGFAKAEKAVNEALLAWQTRAEGAANEAVLARATLLRSESKCDAHPQEPVQFRRSFWPFGLIDGTGQLDMLVFNRTCLATVCNFARRLSQRLFGPEYGICNDILSHQRLANSQTKQLVLIPSCAALLALRMPHCCTQHRFFSLRSLRQNKQRWLHAQPTQLRHAAGQLQVRLHTLQDPHVREANLADELELGVLGQRGQGFRDFEHSANDVVGGVAEVPVYILAQCHQCKKKHDLPKLLQLIQRIVNLLILTALDHILHLHRVRAVHHPEHIIATHQPEADMC